MKYIRLTLIIVCIASVLRVSASGPAPKAICPICKKAFDDGEDKIDRMLKGRFQAIHLDHRDEEKRKERLQLIGQHFKK